MKKLLFVTALLAMGTMTMGAMDLSEKDSTEADVTVIAEIVEDSLVITDIYGKPLVLDFGKIQKGAEVNGTKLWTAEVEYKITAKDTMTADETIDVKLGGTTSGTEVAEVILKPINNTNAGNILTAKLSLDEASKTMKAGKDEVRGVILGSIDESLKDKAEGVYKNTTILTATVK